MSLFSDGLYKEALENTDEALVLRYQRGDNTALNELITRHKDLIDYKSGVYRNVPVPPAAVQGHAMQQLSIAAKKFNVSEGVKFRTFLDSYLRGLNRYVHRHKNIISFPDNKMLLISKFQEAERLLKMQYGYAPDHLIADMLGQKISDVQQLRRKINQKELAESGLENQTAKKQLEDVHRARITERAELIYHSLSVVEKKVYDYAVGAHGHPKLGTSQEIAQRMGINLSKVSRIKKRLAKQIKSIHQFERDEL